MSPCSLDLLMMNPLCANATADYCHADSDLGVIAKVLGLEHRYPEDPSWIRSSQDEPDMSYDNAVAYSIIKNINALRAMIRITGGCKNVDCYSDKYSDDLRCGGVGMGVVDCNNPAYSDNVRCANAEHYWWTGTGAAVGHCSPPYLRSFPEYLIWRSPILEK